MEGFLSKFHNISTGSSHLFPRLARYPSYMKKFPSRGLVALGITVTLIVTAPLAAYADKSPRSQNTSAQRQYQQHEKTYKEARKAIETSFQAAISIARSTYSQAIAAATTSAQRSAAKQALGVAIIQAAAFRSQALITLGKPPLKLA
jgi:hypothetical protein